MKAIKEFLKPNWRKIWLIITILPILIFVFFIFYYLSEISKEPFLIAFVALIVILMPIAIIKSYYGLRLMQLRKEKGSETGKELKRYFGLTIIALIILIIFLIFLFLFR